MKNSLGFQSVLMILLHLFLLLLLLWVATVPLEQIQQYGAEKAGEIGSRDHLREHLVQIEILIWSAIAFTAVIGFITPLMISQGVLNPILSIRNTIRQVSRGDLEARAQVEAGKEFASLADEFNRMTAHRKQEQEQLLNLNRTLSGICACRHEMIHQTDEMRLIQKFCQILVDISAYKMAWIGYAEDDARKTVIPETVAGCRNKDPLGASASWTETALNPAARAIRNRHSAIISDIFGDPVFAPLQAEATRHGYASILALPLSINRQVLGALTLYAEKPDAFGTEEVRLLTELADDLAYGISDIRCAGKNKVRHQLLS